MNYRHYEAWLQHVPLGLPARLICERTVMVIAVGIKDCNIIHIDKNSFLAACMDEWFDPPSEWDDEDWLRGKPAEAGLYLWAADVGISYGDYVIDQLVDNGDGWSPECLCAPTWEPITGDWHEAFDRLTALHVQGNSQLRQEEHKRRDNFMTELHQHLQKLPCRAFTSAMPLFRGIGGIGGIRIYAEVFDALEEGINVFPRFSSPTQGPWSKPREITQLAIAQDSFDVVTFIGDGPDIENSDLFVLKQPSCAANKPLDPKEAARWVTKTVLELINESNKATT
jgi:hypothetical protein